MWAFDSGMLLLCCSWICGALHEIIQLNCDLDIELVTGTVFGTEHVEPSWGLRLEYV
jgi:hypothetical protein